MKKYFILAAVAATFAACSFDKDLGESSSQTITQQEERIPLSIGANYGVVGNATTRSTNQAVQNDTISSVVELGLFVLKDGETKVSSPTQLDYEFFNIKAKAGSQNATDKNTAISASNAANALVFPSDKSQGINLYAYAPYNSTITITDIDASSTTTNVIAVSVQTDQSTDHNFAKSDVIWGCVGENSKGKDVTGSGAYPSSFTGKPGATINGEKYVAAKTTDTDGFVTGTTTSTPKVIIPMLHRASKIVVQLKVSGMPIEKLKGAKVSVNAKAKGNLRIDTGELTAQTTDNDATYIIMTDTLGYKYDNMKASSASDYATALTVSDHDANGKNGVIYVDSNTDADSNVDSLTTYVCSAIVIPQTLTASTELFKIELRDGTTSSNPYSTTYKYFLPASTPSPSSFESGKEYTYTITVKASGLDVVATVEDWDAQAGGTGDATLQ